MTTPCPPTSKVTLLLPDGTKVGRPSTRALVPQQGLMSRDYDLSWPSNQYENALVGSVYHFEWREFEPNRGDYQESIFQGIRDAAADAAALGKGGGVRLNMLGGTQSPQWVKDISDPFPYVEAQAGFSYTCPRWWYDTYQQAWNETFRAIRAEVGEHIAEVRMSGGGTRYGEPFIRSIWANQDALRAVGYTYDIDFEALSNFVTIISCAFPNALMYLSCFPWQSFNSAGNPVASMEATLNAIDAWSIDIVGSHDLREVPGTDRLNTWQALHDTGLPMYFQTAAPARIGDWTKALDYGIQFNARNIELVNAFQDYDYDTLMSYAAIFEAGT